MSVSIRKSTEVCRELSNGKISFTIQPNTNTTMTLSASFVKNNTTRAIPVSLQGIPCSFSCEQLKLALSFLQTAALKVVGSEVSLKLLGGMPPKKNLYINPETLEEAIVQLHSPYTDPERRSLLRVLVLSSAKQAAEEVLSCTQAIDLPPLVDELCSLSKSNDREILDRVINIFKEILSELENNTEMAILVYEGFARFLTEAVLANPFDYGTVFLQEKEDFIKETTLPLEEVSFFDEIASAIQNREKPKRNTLKKLNSEVKNVLKDLQKEEKEIAESYDEKNHSSPKNKLKLTRLNSRRENVFLSFTYRLDKAIRKNILFNLSSLIKCADEILGRMQTIEYLGPESQTHYLAMCRAFNGLLDALLDSGCDRIPKEKKKEWKETIKKHHTRFLSEGSGGKFRRLKHVLSQRASYRNEDLEYHTAYALEAIRRLPSDFSRMGHVREKGKTAVKGILGLASLVGFFGDEDSDTFDSLIDVAKETPELVQLGKSLVEGTGSTRDWYRRLRNWKLLSTSPTEPNILSAIKQAKEQWIEINEKNWYLLFEGIVLLTHFAERGAKETDYLTIVSLLEEIARTGSWTQRKEKKISQIQIQALAALKRFQDSPIQGLKVLAEESQLRLEKYPPLLPLIRGVDPLPPPYISQAGTTIFTAGYTAHSPLMPFVSDAIYRMQGDRALNRERPLYIEPMRSGRKLQQEVYDFIDDSEKRLLVIEGEPGSGKTLFSRFLLEELLHGYPFNDTLAFWKYLPSIKKYIKGGTLMDDLLLQYNLLQHRAALGKQKIVLILDSYDELISSGDPQGYHDFGNIYRVNSLDEWRHLKVIITSRRDVVLANPSYFIPYSNQERVEDWKSNIVLERFQPGQYEEYLIKFLETKENEQEYNAWTPDRYIKSLKEANSDSWEEMFTNPFTLSVIAEALPIIIEKRGSGQKAKRIYERELIEIYLDRFFYRSADKGGGRNKIASEKTLVKKYKQFCIDLAERMERAGVTSVNYNPNEEQEETFADSKSSEEGEEKGNWGDFFSNEGEIPTIRNGCPLNPSPGPESTTTWRWQHDKIFRYFCTIASEKRNNI